MIYNVTKEIESEVRKNNFMGPGIHENCELKHKDGKYPIQFGTSPKGKKFATFNFVNELNEILVHTEWEPQDENEQKLLDKTENQIKRFKHIITKYVSKEKFEGFQCTGFEDFVNKSIAILGNAYVGKKVRVKVTLNPNNYTSLPNYTPFVELMETPKDKSVLSINLAMDKMVKDKPDQETSSTVNPFEGAKELAIAKADLAPFGEATLNTNVPY